MVGDKKTVRRRVKRKVASGTWRITIVYTDGTVDDKLVRDWDKARPRRGASCRHLGDKISEVPCKACSGTIMLKVLQCEKHGKCTVARQIPGLAVCEKCGEYERKEP